MNPVEGERVYWDEIKSIRVSEDDKICSSWVDRAFLVAQVYEQARQEGLNELQAWAKVTRFKIENRDLWRHRF